MAWDRDKERKAGKAMTIGSSVFGVVFLIFWNILAASMGAWFMLLFGIPGLGITIYRLYLCIQYTKQDKPKEPAKEADPWERPSVQEPAGQGNFCPYCGFSLQDGYSYCPKCGRRKP